MNVFNSTLQRPEGFRGKNASVLIIVLWIAFGLVSIALYLGQSMMSCTVCELIESRISPEQSPDFSARLPC